jgi:hypothetical protein
MSTTASDLPGKTGPEIAALVKGGEISQKDAEKFVGDRAVRKLRSALDKLA